jgi:hypothetical protein
MDESPVRDSGLFLSMQQGTTPLQLTANNWVQRNLLKELKFLRNYPTVTIFHA